MDIRKPKTEPKAPKPVAVNQEKTQFQSGSVPHASGRLMIPPAIQQSLTVLGEKYGLPLNLNEVSLDGTLADKIKATRKIIELAEADSKLLPEMFKLVRKLMKSELRLAEFHKKIVKEAIKFNVTLDKQTADIFLAMSGYKAKSIKLEHRTNTRNAIKEKRTQAYTNYYQNTVFASEAEIIDAEYELLASNGRILKESHLERMHFNSDRRNRINEYVQSAYRD